MQLQNYAAGQWVKGSGKQAELVDAITGDVIGTTSSGGLDFGAMLNYAREVGGPPLRKMTFPERGRMLKALAQYLFDQLRRSGTQGAKATEDWGSTTRSATSPAAPRPTAGWTSRAVMYLFGASIIVGQTDHREPL